MWTTFFVCYAFALVILIAPGALFLKGFSFNLPSAIACAAPISVATYVVLGQVFWIMQLSISGTFLFIAALTLAAVIALALKRLTYDTAGHLPVTTMPEHTLLAFGLLMAFAIVVYSTVMPLDGPESFSQHSDNMAHLGSIISMAKTGFYSTFSASSYLATPLNQIPVETSASFYPEGWHIICAMVSSSMGVSAPMAENAVNLAFAGSVFPLGVCILSEAVFSGSQKTMLRFAAIVLSTCFVAFPSGMYLFGPLYPNAASYCSLPALLYLFISVTNCLGGRKAVLTFSIVAFVYAAVGVAALQPNAIFTAAVVLTPYLIWNIKYIFSRFKTTEHLSNGIPCTLIRLGIVCTVLLGWYFLYNLPSFQSVVSFPWPSFLCLKDAIVSGADLGLRFGTPQLLLSIIVWIGLAWTLVNHKYEWITASFIIFLVMYIVGISSEGFAKTFLTGFWYNDHWRTSASLVFPGALLASIGLSVIVRTILRILDYKAASTNGDTVVKTAISLLVVLTIIYPSFVTNGSQVITAFGKSRDTLEQLNKLSESNSYSDADDKFVQRVVSIVGKNDLVINIPADGSISAYMKYGLNCYFKSYGEGDNTSTCNTIVNSLYEYSFNEEVKSAISNTDAKYVLLLDRNGFIRNGDSLWSTDGSMNESDWQGILQLNDNTEGFELVISDQSRKLYRIIR
ncbi:DUF6541 family protein [uncultured Senegalimassilia sp.]|uniref:DUF6541 family protein n=1 Tax=uncultured Senegalimassilia sp. TaxID=1714350 RepID=UPI0025F264C6|nr:DUF6541 family protein [uncultured Senegalimassilia sp.]